MRRIINLTIAAIVVAFMLIEPPVKPPELPADAETYRLVHAIGSVERVSAKGISKEDCQARREELRSAAAGLGSGGSITCLPDSLFD